MDCLDGCTVFTVFVEAWSVLNSWDWCYNDFTRIFSLREHTGMCLFFAKWGLVWVRSGCTGGLTRLRAGISTCLILLVGVDFKVGDLLRICNRNQRVLFRRSENNPPSPWGGDMSTCHCTGLEGTLGKVVF